MSEPFVGEIRLFGFDFCPSGWLPTDGRLMPISSNTALFSLLGTTYGGDGRTAFALPDLRGRTAIGVGTGRPGLSSRTLGQPLGVEDVTLSVQQIPSHTHVVPEQSIPVSVPVHTHTASLKDNKVEASCDVASSDNEGHKHMFNHGHSDSTVTVDGLLKSSSSSTGATTKTLAIDPNVDPDIQARCLARLGNRRCSVIEVDVATSGELVLETESKTFDVTIPSLLDSMTSNEFVTPFSEETCSVSGSFVADTTVDVSEAVGTDSTATVAETTSNAVGGGLSHENMQPSLVLTYCIAIQGVYPSRS